MRGFFQRLRARERRTLAAVGGASLGALVLVGVIPLPGGDDSGSEQPPGSSLQSLIREGESTAEAEFVPGEVIVRFRTDTTSSDRAAARVEAAATVERKLPLPGLQLLQLDKGTPVAEAVTALEEQPEVRYAEPNFVVTAQQQLLPNDPRFADLWGLHNRGQSVNGSVGTLDADADLPEAWGHPGAPAPTGSNAITVAVVDSGVAYDHPELSPNIWRNPGESGSGRESNGRDDDSNGMVDDWRGWDFIGDPSDFVFEDNAPRDHNGHGTHVAGTIGARGNNGLGIAGVNFRVNLMPLRVLDANGEGDVAGLIDAFTYARDEGARIVNASLSTTGYSSAMQDAIEAAPRVLFVVAAGNSGEYLDAYTGGSYPCKFGDTNIICVAATTQTDQLADFSNYGPDPVDLAAPGTSILSSRPSYADRLFIEDFEGDISAAWDIPAWSTWERTNERAKSGSYALSDSPGGDYENDAYETADIRSDFNLVANGRDGCRAFFELNLDTESSYDGLLIREQGGGSLSYVGGYSGSTEGRFEHLSADLSSDFYGDEEHARVGFEFVSDGTGTADGAYIDDVEIACLGVNYTGVEYEFLQGTSQATPLVAGVAALVWAQQPGLSVKAVKDALLANVDRVPALEGKVRTGGRLNADIPWPPFLDATNPRSPADANRPRITGRAQANTTVSLYPHSDCSGSPVAEGPAYQLSSTGIAVTVADNQSRTFWARATGSAGVSACSADSITYVERTPACGGRSVTITGAPDADSIRGTPGPDVIVALGGPDRVRGLGGNDLICGSAGADALLGGTGRDRLYGGGGQDRCNGGPGRDRGSSCERRRAIP